MATRIRLQRHGKKGKAFFHLIIADQRAKRDGKYIEKIGVYNPNTNPATIELDFERTLHWVQTGAEPSETVRAILSYKGVLYKDHLLRGVKKGALTLDQAEAKFNAWIEEKTSKIEGKRSGLDKARAEAERNRIEAERKVSQTRAAAQAAELAAAAQAEASSEEGTPEVESAPSSQAAPEAAAEAVAEPAADEAPAAESSSEESKQDEAGQ